ncbi:MAG: inorganic phosphate transporter [SAR324 cluster bacterium]|nr:inorganic phosphate transporter [SAR324 cluster bacterium]
MLDVQLVLTILVVVVGFYTAWNIGANDVANAMGTSVGSGALTLKQAVVYAAIFEFLGAFLVGSNVSETVRKKMFDPQLFETLYGNEGAIILACAMIAALMAAGTWLMFASYHGWPVSTTHSIVGAVVGVGAAALGFENIEWGKVGLITAGWVVSPLMAGTIAYLLARMLLKGVFQKENPFEAAKKVAPYLAFLVLIVLVGVGTFKGLKPLWQTLEVNPMEGRVLLLVICTALGMGGIGMLVTKRLVRNIHSVRDSLRPQYRADTPSSLGTSADHMDMQSAERVFIYLQVLTACFIAFAHGSNDVANAVGPMSAAYQAIDTGRVAGEAGVPAWTLALGGLGIVAGLAMWGWRVIETIGKRITELTPSRGFAAAFAAAITILLASVLPLGLPVSTTHTLVGAVLGVGFARGLAALDLSVIKFIFAGWVITIPAGATLAIAFFYLLKGVLL